MPAVSAATDKMRDEGLPEIAIETFARYEERLRAGEQGLVRESEIEPLEDVPPLTDLPEGDASALERAVVLKLNGGLGTSMGMTKAKSLLEVKDGHTFLDVIARQILHLRERHGARIPLLLMNSFATRDDTLAALERYPELALDELPLDFLQGKVPKLLTDGYEPADWPDDPALEWAPPGHGDVFGSLAATGLLMDAARAGLRVPLPLELGQPGRDARAAHPGLARERGAAVRVGGRRPHGKRPQGRPPGTAAR